MRILHLIPALASGGAERQLAYLVEALVAAGHDVHVAYVHEDSMRSSHRTKGATFHHIPLRRNTDPALLVRLFGLVKMLRPQVLQSWLLQMDIAAGMVSIATRSIWIIREPNVELAYSNSWKYGLRVLLGKFSNAVVANSSRGASYWARHWPGKRIEIIRNGIPIDQIRRAAKVDLREFGCRPNTPSVLFAGRLVSDWNSEKNLIRLVEAMHVVNRTTPCTTLIAGTGPQRPILEALVADLRSSGLVLFLGQLTPELLWGTMKSASAFALVSPFEGMPNAVMEAIACQCPVVLSDIPPHRELVDSRMACFVNHESVNAIAHGILDCITNSSASEARATLALAQAEEWSIERMAAAYQALYVDLVDARL